MFVFNNFGEIRLGRKVRFHCLNKAIETSKTVELFSMPKLRRVE